MKDRERKKREERKEKQKNKKLGTVVYTYNRR